MPIPQGNLFDMRTAIDYEELTWQKPYDLDTFDVDAFMASCYNSIATGVVIAVVIPDVLNLDFVARILKRDHNGRLSVVGFNSPGEASKLSLVEIVFPKGLETHQAKVRLYYGTVAHSMIEMLA